MNTMAQFFQLLGMTATAAALIGVFLYFALKRYFGSYLDKKAANLADKEDIGDITRIVESIKLDHAREVTQLAELLRSRTSMRLVAAEKRLEAHQRAYAIGITMQMYAHMSDTQKQASLREEWGVFWQQNSLYLEPAVRSAFLDAYSAFDLHMTFRDMGTHDPEKQARDAIARMETMRKLTEVATEAVRLPPIANEQEMAQQALSAPGGAP
jgi:hypothetical protein